MNQRDEKQLLRMMTAVVMFCWLIGQPVTKRSIQSDCQVYLYKKKPESIPPYAQKHHRLCGKKEKELSLISQYENCRFSYYIMLVYVL